MGDPQIVWNDEVKLVKNGDEAAATRLVEALYPCVVRIVRSNKHRMDDEEDICQDIFMKVFSKIHQFSGPQPLPHWVSRIAVNTCYDRLRRHRVRTVMSYSELSVEEGEFLERSLAGASADDSGHETDGESAVELLEKLMATLKPREQMLIRLLDLEERSIREVAEMTGWGDSKIKVTAHRARKKLNANLQSLEQSKSNHEENNE